MKREIGYQHTSFLKLRTGRDYDEFGFDAEYFTYLLGLMGAKIETIDFGGFECEHFEVLSAYLQAQDAEQAHVTITAENRALTKIQNQAKKLAESLEDLELTGQAGRRLFSAISAEGESAIPQNTPQLSNLLGQPDFRMFDGITSMLYELRVALERSKITKPNSLSPPPIPLSRDGFAKYRDKQSKYVVKVDAERLETIPPNERYQRQEEEHKLPANFGLLKFTYHFEELWNRYSPHQFTEGKHEPDARQYISRTVDAAEFCLRKFGATYPRSLIETKTREIRELRYPPKS